MEQSNSNVTPCPKWRLLADMCPKTDTKHQAVKALPYCAIVSKCMYLVTCTRPDIAFVVQELAHFMSNYGQHHFDAAKHLLHYLQGTQLCGIIYGNIKNSPPIFHSFADLDWAMSKGHKSVLGYIIKCEDGLITWSSKQQAIVTLSSCKAKYLSCTHCACQIIWLQSLFNKLGFHKYSPPSYIATI